MLGDVRTAPSLLASGSRQIDQTIRARMIRPFNAICLGLVMIAADAFAQQNPPASTAPSSSQSQVPSAEDHAPPSTPLGSGPAPSAPFKVCGAKNPPPCATPPHVIKHPDPSYSKEARKKNEEHTSVLWLIVGADGLPHDIRVARPVGYGLDEKAIEAVKKWRFNHATMDGHPVSVQINVEVTF